MIAVGRLYLKAWTLIVSMTHSENSYTTDLLPDASFMQHALWSTCDHTCVMQRGLSGEPLNMVSFLIPCSSSLPSGLWLNLNYCYTVGCFGTCVIYLLPRLRCGTNHSETQWLQTISTYQACGIQDGGLGWPLWAILLVLIGVTNKKVVDESLN